MCLVVSSNHRCVNGKFVPVAATKDLLVFKIVRLNEIDPLHSYSQFCNFQYAANTLYKKRKLRPVKEVVFGAGFHAYLCRPYAYHCSYGTKRVEFIIPAGSTVFFGTDGDIVSNQIKSGNLEAICV